MIENGIVLVDRNLRRRQGVDALLRSNGFYVEPFESASEYRAYPLQAATFLVADEQSAVAEMLDAIGDTDYSPSVTVYSDAADAPRIVNAMKAGASNYLVWPFSQATVASAFCRPALPETNILTIRSRILRAKRRLTSLTTRELQVLDLLADGSSSKQVAIVLGISHRTVEIHRSNILLKLGAKNVVQAVKIAIESNFEEHSAPQLLQA